MVHDKANFVWNFSGLGSDEAIETEKQLNFHLLDMHMDFRLSAEQVV